MSNVMEDILAKIRDIDGLPTYEEARFLIKLFEIQKQIFPGEKSWSGYCKENGNIWSVYTVEFIDGLATKLEKLGEGPIIEIFASDGKLSHHLRKRGIEIIATDISPNISGNRDLVERLAYDEALKTYKPRIVIAGWPTTGRQSVINFPTVNHYIEFPYPNKAGYKVYGDGLQLVLLTDVSKYYVCCGDDFNGHFNHETRLFNKPK